ncbi:MAG: DNA polymerase III subunit delta [Armatimonadota bacterium]
MARKTDSVKSSAIRAYLFHGADDAQKKAALLKLEAEIVDPDFRDFDLEQLYGPDVTADRVMTAATIAPFASKQRLVIVTQANDISTAEQQTIASKLEQIPDFACVVFITPAPKIQDGKPKRGSEIHADLTKAIKKAGKSVDFPLMRADAAARFVHDLVKQLGKSISPSAAASVVRRCGTDSGILATEVEKLFNYAGDRATVTDADVQQVITETVEEKIFALMDAIGAKKPALAMHYLHPLLHGGGSEVAGEALRTLVMLTRHFRQLWQARLLIDAGCRAGRVSEEVEMALPENGSILKMEDWKRNKIMEQARNFSLGDLARCFEKIAAADLAIKGIEGAVSDPAMAVEMLTMELSSQPQSKKGRS